MIFSVEGYLRGTPLSANADSAPLFRSRGERPFRAFSLDKGLIPLFFSRLRGLGMPRSAFFGRKVGNSGKGGIGYGMEVWDGVRDGVWQGYGIGYGIGYGTGPIPPFHRKKGRFLFSPGLTVPIPGSPFFQMGLVRGGYIVRGVALLKCSNL